MKASSAYDGPIFDEPTSPEPVAGGKEEYEAEPLTFTNHNGGGDSGIAGVGLGIYGVDYDGRSVANAEQDDERAWETDSENNEVKVDCGTRRDVERSKGDVDSGDEAANEERGDRRTFTNAGKGQEESRGRNVSEFHGGGRETEQRKQILADAG